MIDFGSAPRVRNPVRILLVDDQVIFRTAVRALLEPHRDLVVVGEAGRGEEAVASAEAARPDVVVMDLAMPGKGGIEATRRIMRLGIGARVLVLTALPQERELLDALDAGASGFVEKMEAAEHLVNGIRAVAAGRLFLGPEQIACYCAFAWAATGAAVPNTRATAHVAHTSAAFISRIASSVVVVF